MSTRVKSRTRHSLRRAIPAFALLLGVAAGTPLVAQPSSAVFTDAGAVSSNTLTADALAAPTNLAATGGANQVALSWTATTSTYADGYKVYRSTTSATGPWTLVATVAGRGTTSWTDTTAVYGTSYWYQVAAYRYNWLSGQPNVGPSSPALSVTDTFSGAAGALGNTETGGKTWLFPSAATFTRNGSGKATTTTGIASNPMTVVDAGVADVDITVPVANGGEAIYFRLTDSSNYLRDRARYYTTTSTYQYYTTEYQYNDNDWYDNYQPKKKQVYVQRISRTWSAYTNFADISGTDTGCRGTAPTAPADDLDDWGNPIKQYRWTGIGQGGCNTGQNIYREQERHRTYSDTTTYFWADDPYTPVWGCCNHESLTGSTQTVNNGSIYAKLGTASTQSTSATGTYDVYVNTTVNSSGTYYATSPETTGPTDTQTGLTRQAGPYTGTTTNYYYEVVVEKMVAGTITNLATYSLGSMPTSIRVVAKGSTLSIYASGNLLGTITETAQQAATKHGVGLAGPTDVTPSGIDSFSLTTAP